VTRANEGVRAGNVIRSSLLHALAALALFVALVPFLWPLLSIADRPVELGLWALLWLRWC
jgi:hypothetical protein